LNPSFILGDKLEHHYLQVQKFTHRNVGWDSILDTAVQNFA